MGGRTLAVEKVACSEEYVGGVATKDVDIGEPLWVRLFLPERAAAAAPMPVVLYAHGGAYCMGDPAWRPFHDFCAAMAAQSRCIWVSLAYRLAPAHRLPAAYEDGLAALTWLRAQAASPHPDPWLSPPLADLASLFLAGESAGASIAFNTAMLASPLLPSLSPLRIRGLLLLHPAIHSESNRARTAVDASFDNLHVNRLYDLALPHGETLDYPPVNPLNPNGPSLSPLAAYPRVLLAVAQEDTRYELTMQFYEKIKSICEEVLLVYTPSKGHAFHLVEPDCSEAMELYKHVVDFISPK